MVANKNLNIKKLKKEWLKKEVKKDYFWNLANKCDYSKVVNQKSIDLLRLAYKSGINEFDTAPNYGYGN